MQNNIIQTELVESFHRNQNTTLATFDMASKVEKEAKILEIWNNPNLEDLIFPKFLDELSKEYPWVSSTLDYLKKKGETRFGARVHLDQVTHVAQLLHSLCPRHIKLHNWTLFGAKPGKALGERTMDTENFSGKIRMEVKFIYGRGVQAISFNGPLCFTVGPETQQSLVFMMIPLPEQQGHIMEVVNFAPPLNPGTIRLPATAAFVFKLVPRVFRDLFLLAYVEDLPIYKQKLSLEELLTRIRKVSINTPEDLANADLLFQKTYYDVFADKIENGTYSSMMQKAQLIGDRLTSNLV